MKKILFSIFVALALVAYLAHQRSDEQSTPVVEPVASASSLPSNNATTSYKDGTYTGSVADAYYGPLQVRATISGGKITDVTFLQYPSDRGESVQVNSQAMPYLRSEAIAAQSANVDIVTGATQSSGAFRTSLASALSQAQ